jgi:hypothetical protein
LEFERKAPPSKRSLITLKAFLRGYSLWLTADKCDFAMTVLIEMVNGQFGAVDVVYPDVIEASGRAREGDRRQSANESERLSAEPVMTERRAHQNACRRKVSHRLQQTRLPGTILTGVS